MAPDNDWRPSDDMHDCGDEDEDFDFDCHLDWQSGQCGAAGSEWCEFECPYVTERDAICAGHAMRRPKAEKPAPPSDPWRLHKDPIATMPKPTPTED